MTQTEFAKNNHGITPAMFESEDWLKQTGFVIPLYQRLFVWEDEQIERLLEDLWTAFSTNASKPYYIGILTVTVRQPNGRDKTTKNEWELVDGQQRITVLTLLGIAFARSNLAACKWRNFLQMSEGQEARLRYYARPDDQKHLEGLIKENPSVSASNQNFTRFFAAFHRFRNRRINDKKPFDEKAFSDFVFTKTIALVSFLPEALRVNDLNAYFERMNSAGRQLEPHEILKVRYFGDYSSMWNAILDGGQAFDPNKLDIETNADGDTVRAILNTGGGLTEEDRRRPEPAGEEQIASSIRLILSIPVFLLHVLRLSIGKVKSDQIACFWDTKNLLATFSEARLLDDCAKAKFLEEMRNYRQWLDKWIIHMEDDHSHPPDSSNDEVTEDKALWQFQSMLWASGGDRQEWVLDAYEESCGSEITPVELLRVLKQKDKEQHPFDYEKAKAWSYPTIDRYWFWKLDYILWELWIEGKLDDMVSEKEQRDAIKVYRFRRNRSIEHLHPQNPENPKEGWNDSELHCFGNLAMISSSFNSAQGRDDAPTKYGRMIGRIENHDHDIQSIKLLLMFVTGGRKYDDWTSEKAAEHQKGMLKHLKDYYDNQI